MDLSLLSSLQSTTTMDLEKAMARRALSRQPSITANSAALLGAGSTSAATSPIEHRLMLDLLAAESALEGYRNAKAEELALMRGLAHKREALRAALLPTAATMNSVMAESCVIPVRPKSISALLDTETGKLSSLQLPSALYSTLRRPSSGVVSTLIPEATTKNSPLAAGEDTILGKQQQPRVAKRRHIKCWDVAVSFPSKLFNMLEEADGEGHADIVSFLPDGKCFKIHKPEEFAQEVLPKYFRTSRLSSMQKQLSLYGFRRIRSGPNRGAVFHEHFQRDDKKLVAKIQRRRQRIPQGEPEYQKKARALAIEENTAD